MNKLSRISTMIGTSIIALGSFQSCVDDDYDLSKDMNLVVNVGGGQLSVPGSSTELFSLEKLLDLDPESSIKAADQATAQKYGLTVGDYLLIQSGDPSEGNFEIENVDLEVNGTHQLQTVQFPVFPAQLQGQIGSLSVNIGGTDADTWNKGIPSFDNSITLHESNVNNDIVEISRVETDIDLLAKVDFGVTNYSGHVTVAEGFEIRFGETVNNTPQFEISLYASIPGCSVIDGHIIRFSQDYDVMSNVLELPIHIDAINCPDALNPNTHDFDFASSIVTTGKLFIGEPQPGEAVTMNINVTIGDQNGGMIHGDITAVTGIVNPAINIDPVNFEINDIPDFLKEDSNLDIENPQIYLTIDNTSAASVNVAITLTGEWDDNVTFPNGRPSVYQALTIAPGMNKICICRKNEGIVAGYTAYANNTIGELISKIPNSINVDIQANVKQELTRFELGRNYTFRAENEVVAPLAFGNNLSFTYSDTEDGWDSDLGKYDFNKVQIEMEVTNTAPLNFEVKASPVYVDGNPRDKVQVIIEKRLIEAGTIANPSVSKVVIALKGNGENFTSPGYSSLNGLDGIKYELVTNNNQSVAGIPINEGQGMKFTEIRARIIGGITLDLDEM